MEYYATIKKIIISLYFHVYNFGGKSKMPKICIQYDLFYKTITKTPIYVYISLDMNFINKEKGVKGCTPSFQH